MTSQRFSQTVGDDGMSMSKRRVRALQVLFSLSCFSKDVAVSDTTHDSPTLLVKMFIAKNLGEDNELRSNDC